MDKLLFLFVIALCGTHASSLNAEGANRIINGLPAAENQFSYMISLQKLSEIQSYTRGHKCGGALVSLQHAVTAASCNFNTINGASVEINPAEYRVFAGSVFLTDDNSPYRYRSIRDITVHPLYSTSRPFENDIAIIFLAAAFSSITVTPVSLPTTDTSPNALTPCFVSGWGAQNTTATASTRLMFMMSRVREQSLCQAYYGSLEVNQLDIVESMVCAWNILIPFSGCTGDIGNPLVCDNSINGIQIRNKNCTASLEPEVYTRISAYGFWINGYINPPVPDGAFAFQPGMAVLAVVSIVQIIKSGILLT